MSDSVTAAAERLDRALAALEASTRDLKARAAVGDDDLFAAVPSGDAALRAAAAEASATLGRVADELRAILAAEE